MSENNNSSEPSLKPPLTDENQKLVALIGACAASDAQAFSELYKKTSPQLFAVLRRMLRSEAVAEEALQEAFFKIWNNAKDYDQEKSLPRTWLISIARYHAIDVLRKRSSREDHELPIDPPDMGNLTDKSPHFEKQFADSEELTLCLDELSESARQCVVGAYCMGFSHHELSENLQRPIGTIKSWLRRSLLSLKECLHGYA